MRKTGYVYDLRYMLHDTGPYHPEMAERCRLFTKALKPEGCYRI